MVGLLVINPRVGLLVYFTGFPEGEIEAYIAGGSLVDLPEGMVDVEVGRTIKVDRVDTALVTVSLLEPKPELEIHRLMARAVLPDYPRTVDGLFKLIRERTRMEYYTHVDHAFKADGYRHRKHRRLLDGTAHLKGLAREKIEFLLSYNRGEIHSLSESDKIELVLDWIPSYSAEQHEEWARFKRESRVLDTPKVLRAGSKRRRGD